MSNQWSIITRRKIITLAYWIEMQSIQYIIKLEWFVAEYIIKIRYAIHKISRISW